MDTEDHASSPKHTLVTTEEKRLSFWWVLGIVFGLSCIMALIAHRSLTHSVTSIKGALVKMKKSGSTLEPEQCAGRVLQWVRRCDSMQSLCDASVHRLMGKCLEGQSRQKACITMDLKKTKAHFSFARCKKWKLHRGRRWKKVCGGIYSTLWIHCMYWRTGKLKKIKSKESKNRQSTPRVSPKARGAK